MAGEEGDPLIAAIEKVVKWQVENTQPDNTTQEPWGVAAFPALDETGTFAAQQVHDATQRLTAASRRLPNAVSCWACSPMPSSPRGDK